MKIIVNLAEGQRLVSFEETEGVIGEGTVVALSQVFAEALFLAHRKAQTYRDTWSDQGYMGNVGRVLSKASRMRNMLWRDYPIDDIESVEDTLLDLVNLAAFTLINRRERNKWGDRHHA